MDLCTGNVFCNDDQHFFESVPHKSSQKNVHQQLSVLFRWLPTTKTLAPLVKKLKHAVYTHHSFLKTLDSFLESSHEKLNVLQKKAAAMAENNEPDPALRFLQSIQKQHEFKRMANEIHPIRDESNSFLRHAKYVCHHLSQNHDRFPPPSTAAFSIVTCPVDGTKISLPDNSNEQTATCPTCKYRFEYNTKRPIFDESVPAKSLKLTWRTRLAKLFGK